MTAVFASARRGRVPLRRAVDSERCRVPARRPGNFHLLAQMKVTKAKGLNTDLGGMLGCELGRSLWNRGASDRYLVDPSSRCDFIDQKALLPLPGHSSDRRGGVARSRVPAVDRSRFEPQEIRRRSAASKSARKRCEPLGETKPRALSKEVSGQIGIQALCFGDFHLCRQMKVTRPPGRDPAPHMRNRPPGRNPATPR
jgi:hypothetical protein